jgi:hypothetical protein
LAAAAKRLRINSRKRVVFIQPLISNARFFHWLPSTIPETIKILDMVAWKVSVFDFGFVPDSMAVEQLFLKMKAISQAVQPLDQFRRQVIDGDGQIQFQPGNNL